MGADTEHMGTALELARQGLGEAWPNPAVGCLIVEGTRVVGRGRTQAGGRPHAEVVALQQAGGEAVGATAYVTLEPCAHTGKTPPCADALVRARIARCVVALRDPDPRVDGGGIRKLKAAGIDVELGVLGVQAAAVNDGFLHRIRYGQPLLVRGDAVGLDAFLIPEDGTVPDDTRIHLYLDRDLNLVSWEGMAAHADQTAALDQLGTVPFAHVLERLGEIGLNRVGAPLDVYSRLTELGA